ncbi:MAG TPA: hypothetical protein PKD86_16475 [Gemmatales bacterium]|nr:hypothetical protein [Gemmatales bacterium]HMP60942.1 hypothetical protein [Gemmatales bacterium]
MGSNENSPLSSFLLLGLAGCAQETTYEGRCAFDEAPADDKPLRNWLEAQPGVRDVSVNREGKTIRFRYTKEEASQEPKYLAPPAEDLGYGKPRVVEYFTVGPRQMLARLPADRMNSIGNVRGYQ